MPYKNKVRLSVVVDYELDNRLSEVCENLGVSKTQLCCNLIRQGIDVYELTLKVIYDPNFIKNTYTILSKLVQLNDKGNNEELIKDMEELDKIKKITSTTSKKEAENLFNSYISDEIKKNK